MSKKQKNISNSIQPVLTVLGLLAIWQLASSLALVPEFMLPSPIQVIQAFISDFNLLMFHSKITLFEALLGLLSGVSLGVLTAIVMDRFTKVKKSIYPLLILTQTVPTVAIAPLLTIWFGYGILPKVVLITITIFFPVSVGMLNGFMSIDPDEINLLRSMGASHRQIFWHIKLPASLGNFFASLRIAVTYAVVGAVISEWLGGFEGLGVYMTRVRKSYHFDKMFAVIFLISIISLLLMAVVNVLEKICMPWQKQENI